MFKSVFVPLSSWSAIRAQVFQDLRRLFYVWWKLNAGLLGRLTLAAVKSCDYRNGGNGGRIVDKTERNDCAWLIALENGRRAVAHDGGAAPVRHRFEAVPTCAPKAWTHCPPSHFREGVLHTWTLFGGGGRAASSLAATTLNATCPIRRLHRSWPPRGIGQDFLNRRPQNLIYHQGREKEYEHRAHLALHLTHDVRGGSSQSWGNWAIVLGRQRRCARPRCHN